MQKLNFKVIQDILASAGLGILFAYIREDFGDAIFAVPFLIYCLFTDSETKSLLLDYTHRTVKSLYLGAVFLVLMSIQYELRTSFFYAGMRMEERIFVAALMSIVITAVMASITFAFEYFWKKFRV